VEGGAYEELVGAVLCDPALVPLVRGAGEVCPDGELAEILRAVIDLYEDADADAELDVGGVLDRLIERPARARVIPLAEHARLASSPREFLQGALQFLERRRLEAEQASLARTLGELEGASGAFNDAVNDPRAIELSREATRIREALQALTSNAYTVPR
jgi:hypothetical protein